MDKHIEYDRESYNELLNFTENDNELSFKGRLLIYSLKFADLIAVSDYRTTIQLSDIEDSILLVDYYKKNVERLLNTELSKSEFSRKEQRIIDFLKNQCGKAKRSLMLNRLNIKAKELDEIISNLFQKKLLDKSESYHQYNKSKVVTYKLKVDS